MSDAPILGMIVPTAAGQVPADATVLYPEGVQFIASGLGLGKLTPEGYASVIDRTGEMAQALAARGAQAISLMGTSLTFFRGSDFNNELIDTIHAATGLPATTMSTGVVEGLRAVGAHKVAVGTAYIDEVNRRLQQFLVDNGFEVLALEGLGLDTVGEPGKVSQDELVALGERVCAAAPDAEALLLSCGGLRTLPVTVPLEQATGLPVISSTPAALWASVRLVGHSGEAPGYGRLLSSHVPADTTTATR